MRTVVDGPPVLEEFSKVVNKASTAGTTALHKAARKGHKSTVLNLLALGANPNAQLRNGKTPLHLAAEEGKHIVIQQLLDAGGNKEIRDNHGRLPLFYAI